MLRLVVDAVMDVCDPVLVIAAARQVLPELPDSVRVLTDSEPDQGPLHGLALGLTALASCNEVCFVASCDLPYLHPDFIRAVLSQLGDHAAAVPSLDGQLHPLAAAYRVSVAATAQQSLKDGNRRMTDFAMMLDPMILPAESLPLPASLININTPADLTGA